MVLPAEPLDILPGFHQIFQVVDLDNHRPGVVFQKIIEQSRRNDIEGGQRLVVPSTADAMEVDLPYLTVEHLDEPSIIVAVERYMARVHAYRAPAPHDEAAEKRKVLVLSLITI